MASGLPRSAAETAWRLIPAPPAAVYAALTDPAALEKWLPPKGMRARILAFEPRPGGAYDVEMIYVDPHRKGAGKTDADRDLVRGRFVALERERRIVQAITFQSDNPAFAGTMTMTWSLEPSDGGTRLAVTCQDVPVGIRREDHEAGIGASLDNLARFLR